MKKGDIQFKSVHTANYGTFAISQDGQLYAYGRNANGELGVGDTKPRKIFSLVQGLSGQKVNKIWLFSDSIFVSTVDGKLFERNSNYEFQCVKGLDNSGINYVGNISGHLLVLTKQGTLYTRKFSAKVFVAIEHDVKFIKSFQNGSGLIICDSKGKLYAFGVNTDGRLGISPDQSVAKQPFYTGDFEIKFHRILGFLETDFITNVMLTCIPGEEIF